MSKDVKLINLDEMATPVTKQVRFGGEDHDVAELTIGNFGRAMELQQRLNEIHESGEDIDPATGLAAYVDLVCITIPSLTEEQVKALNLRQWMALVEFIMALGLEDALDEEEVAEMGKPEKTEDQ